MDTKELCLTAKSDKKGVLLQLIEPIRQGKVTDLPVIQKVLQEYKMVFNEPVGLPPVRACDHSIPLKEGTSPVSVRPYRYPFYPKEEIEKIVRELLSSGVIRINQNPSHPLYCWLVKLMGAGECVWITVH